jgi:hypothetical protein
MLLAAPIFLVIAGAGSSAAEDPMPTPFPFLADESLHVPISSISLLARQKSAQESLADIRIDTVVRSMDSVVQTPWNTPAFTNAQRPGLILVRQEPLPWGLAVEWQVGVAATPASTSPWALANASQWSIRKAFGRDLLLYFHDRGSGFVKACGENLSVFGRYSESADNGSREVTMQIGAARKY